MPNIPVKIADGLTNAQEILGDRYTKTFTDDGKLWFVSRKGVSQPSISFYHETPLQGGNVVYFDTHTKTWSSPHSFALISDEELLEGHVFGYKNNLLLITFEQSNRFQFRDLYEWKNNQWQKIDQLEIDEKTKFEFGARLKYVDGGSGRAHSYFVVERGYGVNICRFEFSENGGKASIILEHEIESLFSRQMCGTHLVRLAIRDNDLYVLYGQQGCGFHWEPTRPIKIDLRDAKVERLLVGEENRDSCPPWAFSGSYADQFFGHSSWYFFGGCLAKGMASTKPDQSIWILDLDALRWNRFEYDIPEGAIYVGAVTLDKEIKFYLVNVADGVYEISQKM